MSKTEVEKLKEALRRNNMVINELQNYINIKNEDLEHYKAISEALVRIIRVIETKVDK